MNEAKDSELKNKSSEENKPPTTKPSRGETKAAICLGYLDDLPIWRTPTGRVFASINGAAVPLRKCEQLKAYVSAKFAEENNNDTVSESVIEQAVLAVTGRILPTREMHVRVAGDEEHIEFDLACGNRSVFVSANGLHVGSQTTPFFRPPGTGSVEIADLAAFGLKDAAAAFGEFYDLLGVYDESTQAATTGFMVQSARPLGPYAMYIQRGPQGSGKSTQARWIRRVMDPRSPEDVELPHGNRHLAIFAEHAHLLSFDNVSIIDQSTSDACCRLATGSGFVTRALRTDRELATFLTARPLMFTSIGDIAVAPGGGGARSRGRSASPARSRVWRSRLRPSRDRLVERLQRRLDQLVPLPVREQQ